MTSSFGVVKKRCHSPPKIVVFHNDEGGVMEKVSRCVLVEVEKGCPVVKGVRVFLLGLLDEVVEVGVFWVVKQSLVEFMSRPGRRD